MSKTKESALQRIKNNQEGVPAVDTFAGLNTNGIQDIFELYRDKISLATQRGESVDRVISLATQIISRTPKIQECTAPSIIGSVMRAVTLGLDFSPEIGQCHLIPRWNSKLKATECTFMIGYGGYITLAYNTDRIKSLTARVVRKGDFFQYEYGLVPSLRHVVKSDGEGELIHAYAIWNFVTGGNYFEVMSKKQVLAAKAKSPAKDKEYSPWNDPDQVADMWIKTVIRHSRKYIPLSTVDTRRLAGAMSVDEEVVQPDRFDKGLTGADLIKQEVEIPDKPEPTEDEILRDTQSNSVEPPPPGPDDQMQEPTGSIGDENSRPPDQL